MQETMNVAASDDQLMMRQRERAARLHTKKMEALFAAADESGDGFLDYDEFMAILTKPEIKSWLAAQQLDVSDAELMFVLMDDGDEQISAPELVKAAGKLKGPARSIDLHNLMMEHDDLKKLVLEIKQSGPAAHGSLKVSSTTSTLVTETSTELAPYDIEKPTMLINGTPMSP